MTPKKKVGKTSWINFTLQTQSDVKRGVCFALEKTNTITSYAEKKSPVKIKNFSLSHKYGREDIVIGKNTIITPAKLSFEYETQDTILSISSLARVASEQLVKIKGYVGHVGAVKKIAIKGKDVKKQECYITDPSGFVKLIL